MDWFLYDRGLCHERVKRSYLLHENSTRTNKKTLPNRHTKNQSWMLMVVAELKLSMQGVIPKRAETKRKYRVKAY